MQSILIFLALFTQTAYAQTLPPVVYSTSTAPAIIEAYAAKYGTPAAPLVATLNCESHFAADRVGDHGTSFGVAQIHLPAHPDITKEQALDPMWAVDYAAREFAAGNAGQWTCYKKLYE